MLLGVCFAKQNGKTLTEGAPSTQHGLFALLSRANAFKYNKTKEALRFCLFSPLAKYLFPNGGFFRAQNRIRSSAASVDSANGQTFPCFCYKNTGLFTSGHKLTCIFSQGSNCFRAISALVLVNQRHSSHLQLPKESHNFKLKLSHLSSKPRLISAKHEKRQQSNPDPHQIIPYLVVLWSIVSGSWYVQAMIAYSLLDHFNFPNFLNQYIDEILRFFAYFR